jgi:superfamily II DNA or RNA helicase
MKRHFFTKVPKGPKGGPKGPKGPIKEDVYDPTEEYKARICQVARIGRKGYVIPKTILDTADYEFLKKDLIMKPFVGLVGGGAGGEEVAFPVYRENESKIYLPRFYGIERYGQPLTPSEIPTGESIDVKFPCALRDYQEKIINIYMTFVKDDGGAILEVPCGRGKTVMALKIISLLKKKTLILVHKEFLMNQWIERIAEFLPGAKVGKIQGSVFQVEGCDIVIGMIQTMFSRDFPIGTFDPFGLTVIDEVHRIGSEEFSKTLLKTITPFMLGISATVERKDRLTKILYMFIGPKIYEEEREDEDPVIVRGIEYVARDSAFEETEYDFRGMPKFSTMISKLCEYGPRSDFVVRVIGDLLEEDPDKQIMVLAHNRCLLTYLHDAIQHRGLATVGYYVGGMKEAALKETEQKQVVIATYAMAAEALDIKTLSTLVMATPKTDIEQSVGRILRARHSKPIVVDIVDGHDLFKNQWRTRKTFYRKCNYMIKYIKSTDYRGFLQGGNEGWKTEFVPRDKGAKTKNSGEEVPIRKCFISYQEI